MFFITLVCFFSTAYYICAVLFYTIYDNDTITSDELLSESGRKMYGKSCFFSHRFNSLLMVFLSLDLCIVFILPCPVLTLECRVIVRKQHGSIKQRFETYFMQIKCVSFSSYLLYTCFVTLPLKRGSQHIL